MDGKSLVVGIILGLIVGILAGIIIEYEYLII
jgi:galactitol-specific phosphotransferase system IIC component